MRIYQSREYLGSALKLRCSNNPRGRVIYRWEHKEILEEMRKRVESNKDKVEMRQ